MGRTNLQQQSGNLWTLYNIYQRFVLVSLRTINQIVLPSPGPLIRGSGAMLVSNAEVLDNSGPNRSRKAETLGLIYYIEVE